MLANVIRLARLSCLSLCIIGLPNVMSTAVVFAEIGHSKTEIEQQYGEYSMIQDKSNHVWACGEWKPSFRSEAKAYGYMTTIGERNITSWIEYNQENRVVKETILFDKSIKIRDFNKYFADLYNAIVAPESEVFQIKAFPKEQLGVFVNKPGNQMNFIRFYTDNTKDNTPINMHTKLKGFEITEIEAKNSKEYLRNESWRKTDNYFKPELYFSEKLMPRQKTNLIVVHHTKIDNVSVADIHEMHLHNGWAGVAYHKVILPDGSVENARPEPMIGAHARGGNDRSIGVVVVGDFENAPPTATQMDTLVNVTLGLMQKYHITYGSVLPHRGVTQGTKCPGELFPWEAFIDRLKKGKAD